MMGNEATSQVEAWLHGFEQALATGAPQAAAQFAPDSLWRDLVAFTWNIVTLEGPAAIAAMLAETLPGLAPIRFTLEGQATTDSGTTSAWFTFETAISRGKGHLRLRDGRATTFFTAMRELKGHEEKTGPTREEGVIHGALKGGRPSWLDRRQHEQASIGVTTQPFVLVIGGGQGGIALGARLQRLGVPALIIDRNPRAGDAWRNRYKSLCLHDAVWYDHLPYMPFPEHWPVYTPKDKMGDWLEMYVNIMELNYWTSATCRGAQYDEATAQWSVQIERDGQTLTVHPHHIVLATGMSGVPERPNLPGMDSFQGRQHHSSAHPGGEDWAGKNCIVVGANNSAHDIAVDLWEHGAHVTMIQRSSTPVARASTLRRNGDAGLYSERAVARGIDVDTADLIVASTPYKLLPDLQRPVAEQLARDDADFYARLRAVGFQLDFGDDGSGLSQKYLRRGSGYYIDVGGSDLVASGEIALRSGVDLAEIRPHSLVLSNGEELPADLIVYATGYGSMTGWAAALISPEVAAKVGKCWGLGSNTNKDPGPWEGELRNMWKPTRQPGLWFHGGNLAQSRHYSLYLALQLKARFEGIPTPIHALAPVHHAS
jgi:putative flavoprotein involved in K+ transport